MQVYNKISMGYSRKNPNIGRKVGGGGGWGQIISKGIEERACGSSKGHLKKKWNFQGCQRKTNVEFPKCVTQFYRIFRDESLFSPEFLRLKWQI